MIAVNTADLRNRPIVLEARSPDQLPRARRSWPHTMLGVAVVAVIAVGG